MKKIDLDSPEFQTRFIEFLKDHWGTYESAIFSKIIPRCDDGTFQFLGTNDKIFLRSLIDNEIFKVEGEYFDKMIEHTFQSYILNLSIPQIKMLYELYKL